MPYIPHTDDDVQAMLKTIGAASIDELFSEIPAHLKINQVNVPHGLNEMQLARLMSALAMHDDGQQCYIGAGAYEHHIPACVWDIVGRGEFMTAYTPYQAEASQGTLQVLYEYQTMMASLTGMDVSNASCYDGASALAEAVLMAVRANKESHAKKILMPLAVHPAYRATVETLVTAQGIHCELLPYSLETGQTDLSALTQYEHEDITALVIPMPNFFGVIEEVDALTRWAHAKGAFVIAVCNPVALALLKEPGVWGDRGADIACGEAQPLGMPLASGGPYAGFLCAKKMWIRQMPGRIVGRTLDKAGNKGFTLTLQAREQHIRRSKATSNICTNQGLLVTAATIYLATVGLEGLKRVALTSHHQMRVLKERMQTIVGVKCLFSGSFFHEYVFQLPVCVDAFLEAMTQVHIQAGFNLTAAYPELKNALLVCVTETKTDEDIAAYVSACQAAITRIQSGVKL